jgi:hypothetical protein
MLYAHTEGFCKVALSTYVKAINELGLRGREALESISACAFFEVFHAIKYGDPKGKVFKNPLPDDQALHVFCRQREFMGGIDELLSRPLSIPDGAVDTESNLNSRVLRRNLFRLGFSPDKFSSYESDLDELVYRRHSIAHGIDIGPVRRDVYERLYRAALQFMDELALGIVDAIQTSGYLRKTAPAA